MVTTKLYLEGAGPRRAQQSQCRRAFARFFEAAGVQKRPAIQPCGGRTEAYDAFRIALKTGGPVVVPLLLVDAEGPVAKGHSVWHHLKVHDGWNVPPGAQDDQAFLMVQVMESWFLADVAALRRHFGPGFVETPFRAWPALEDIPKQTVYDVLDKATRNCRHSYEKGDVSFAILSVIDPGRVAAACPHAHALLERLRSL